MNLRVAHPLRSLQRVGYVNVGIEILGSTLRKEREGWGTRSGLHVPLRCPAFGAALCKEGR
jgi:hypothetical protein